MKKYYVDFDNGTNKNDGLSEKFPIKTMENIELMPGDSVLFKRDTSYFGKLKSFSGEIDKPIIYGAYGQGRKPVINGAESANENDNWEEIEKNIWKCTKYVSNEVGNIVFDDGNSYGAFRWNKEELSEQGDWFESAKTFGSAHKEIPSDRELLIYSEGNPAEFYKSIEFCIWHNDGLLKVADNIIVCDIEFKNSGGFVMASECGGKNILVKNCSFLNIGGVVWSEKLKIRFGNAVEFWNTAEDIHIENCLFDNIYDSAVTHQGSSQCQPAKNFIITNNIFKRCGMAAYEQRDVMPFNAEFSGNICEDAGEGFSCLGETMPRNSEIWPQPMGHHVFLWRIKNITPGGILRIENNIFQNAIYGKAIYSIIDDAPQKQVVERNNEYKGTFIE